ncbi:MULTISPECIES: hypothetical protein [Pseudoalteromonas]|uniref:hypothetical protein n=1 Tax=Pseudoalteromonas TaxID=53246 RepID=UPI00029ADC4D|nr:MULTISPECIES: hypothetical protein [Pseudoalteromonas]AUJ70711.1 hypothetical protein PNC201_12230 [Pseudoalteromonas sp. NC201]MBR8845333.1 hypothetical protein [Pseudoalteromonas sp. JC3]MCF7512510.1 hypothetical protein [Pseudoalteromonas sp. L7]MCF7524276.1 hypothetical protein [Pseudoalteromonas sp. L23]MCG7554011.1 hypothetical protein [Pseudoalteromonas sp. Of11M-6]
MHPAVARAIKKLVDSGKTPTVALTKSKLTQSVAMPDVISGIAAYKQDPTCIEHYQEVEEVVKTSSQSQLDRIEAKLDKLIALLEKS